MELFRYFFQSITVWMNYVLSSLHYIGGVSVLLFILEKAFVVSLLQKKKCTPMVYVKDLATSLSFLEQDSAGGC